MATGIINILKPPGMTSHDVVSFIRKTYSIKRVGHAGTLDPAAAGVLPVFVGQATRLIEYVADADKSYRAELTFGYETDTGDDTGKIINTAAFTMPTVEEIQDALESFTGTIEQVPPMYSAIKVAGKKLYELAREGIVVERKSRKITIFNITLVKITETGILFDVTCSKGTYIRSLCMDIGQKLGCLAVMSFLVRTRVGNLSLTEARTMEEVTADKETALIPVDTVLAHMPEVILPPEKAQAFKYGQHICYTANLSQDIARIYDNQHNLIGIGQKTPGSAVLIPIKVLASC